MTALNINKSGMFFLIILFSLVLVEETKAGAWTQKKNSGYYSLDFRFLSGSELHGMNGSKIHIPKFKDFTTGFFGAYGISTDATVFLGAAVFKSISLDTSSSAAGFDTDAKGIGDINVGVKYKLAKFGSTVLSAKLILGLPTGSSDKDDALWTGSSDFNQEIGVEAGPSFYPAPFYLTGGVSINNRTKGFSDEFSYGVEGGYKFLSDLTLVVRLHGQLSLKNGDDNVIGGYGIYLNNQEYFAYNAQLVYKITNNFGVKGSYENGVAAKNIISSPVLSFGVFVTE